MQSDEREASSTNTKENKNLLEEKGESVRGPPHLLIFSTSEYSGIKQLGLEQLVFVYKKVTNQKG